MDLLKIRTIWSNAELWLYKFCAACGGVILGIFFYDFLKGHLFELISAFTITVIWVAYIWSKKIRNSK
jgi:hypothetical protein